VCVKTCTCLWHVFSNSNQTFIQFVVSSFRFEANAILFIYFSAKIYLLCSNKDKLVFFIAGIRAISSDRRCLWPAVGHVARQEFLARLHANVHRNCEPSRKTIGDISAKVHMNVWEIRENKSNATITYLLPQRQIATYSRLCCFAKILRKSEWLELNTERSQKINIQKIERCFM